ncbi:hypothetical protein POL68_28535 [Stigmatella sp. ncwal1]|uniref:Uncharacterized protein n=1 Tax=Stigmatella ashevillensis TaxID=2995309 RepID=A0ABT5DI50_9BACT|nr:hypothetical protein [Stigmatella ashevillena]MDC0712443.1 hypothetical protein [Stigmatella ashevillena]
MSTAALAPAGGPLFRLSSWSCGQRSLTRISELRALCDLMAQRPNAAPQAPELAEQAKRFLANASLAAERKRPPWGRLGAFIDTIETNIHAAICLLLRYMPPKDLRGWLPELSALIQAHLPAQDPRRAAVEHLQQRILETEILALDESTRETLVTAIRATLDAQEREYVRVRSFRNIVYGVTLSLALLAVALGALMAVNPRIMPICFQPENRIVCPTASEPHSAQMDPDPVFARLANSTDYFIIELVGLISAAVSSAAALRQLRGTSVPYSVPLALSLLKLPTGALTAVLGLLLMRGEFLPGLSALDSSAQIIAWAVVFGYAQQLFTRLVDERGQAILNSVGGAEHAKLMDQRIFSTPARTPE